MDNSVLKKSSTAQYLTFVASNGWDATAIEMRYEDENLWLTQKMIAELYGVSVPTLNEHIKSLITSGEIQISTVKKYLIVLKVKGMYENFFTV